MADGPELSVILTALGHADDLETTLLHLRRQTAAGRIELLVVTPSRERLGALPVDLAGLRGVRVVEAPGASTVSRGNAAGVRAARAPVVVLAEDHAFPDPGWAEALLRAHDGSIAAAGPVVANANPRTAASWADFVMGYGHWMAPCAGGAVPFLPGHNTSYRRDLLLARDRTLERDLEAETVLHLEWSAGGERLVVVPGAGIAHVNFSRWGPKLRASFHHGRVFAASRATRWRRPRRLAFALAAPAIPVVRFARVLGQLAPAERRRQVPWTAYPALLLGLAADAAGQAAGYAAGAGRSGDALGAFEAQRTSHVTSRDRADLARLTESLRDA